MTSTDELITATKAGLILGCSARTISRKAERGEIPFEQKLPGPNGAYLFRRSTLLHFAADQASGPQPAEQAVAS